MSFGQDIRRWVIRTQGLAQDVFVGSAQLCHQSIQEGSEITGAPGQPVDLGNLFDSWIIGFPEKTTAEVTTNVAYAPAIENNDRSSFDPTGVMPDPELVKAQRAARRSAGGGSRHQRSQRGGNHSVKITVAGFQRIVDHVTREVTGQ